MTTVDLQFRAPTEPLSVNAADGHHWAVRRRRLKPWQDAAWAVAHNYRVAASRTPRAPLGFAGPKPITVQVVLPFRRARRRDAHNYTGTVVKAVVDGIVRAGLVPDDTPDWVTVLDPILCVIREPQPLTVTVHIRPRETP